MPKSPISTVGKNKLYDTFSITVRTGRGVDSWLDTPKWVQFLNGGEKIIPHEWIISIEKSQEGRKAHYQCAFKYPQPLRVDHVKRKLMDCFVDDSWSDAMLKHAVCVKPHKNWLGIVGYCLKEQSGHPFIHNLSRWKESGGDGQVYRDDYKQNIEDVFYMKN